MRTYRDLFQRALEEWIAAGGDVGHVVTLVNMYQRTDPIARQFAFQDWLGENRLPCGRCGFDFRPDPEKAEEPDEVLCVSCL